MSASVYHYRPASEEEARAIKVDDLVRAFDQLFAEMKLQHPAGQLRWLEHLTPAFWQTLARNWGKARISEQTISQVKAIYRSRSAVFEG